MQGMQRQAIPGLYPGYTGHQTFHFNEYSSLLWDIIIGISYGYHEPVLQSV